MKIIQDTREQNFLIFDHPQISEIVVETLEYGDYGCRFEDDYTVPVIFERKSLPDLFSTLTSGYERFKKEINRASDAETTLVLITECSKTKIKNTNKEYRKKGKTRFIKGSSIYQTMFTLWVRYNLMFVCCNTREEMVEYITQFYLCCGREYLIYRKELAGFGKKTKRRKK